MISTSVTTSISLTISLGNTRLALGNTMIKNFFDPAKQSQPQPKPQLKPKQPAAPSTVIIEEIDDDEKEKPKSKPKEIEDTSKALVLVNHTPATKKQERREAVKTGKIIHKNSTSSMAQIKQFKPFVMPANSNHHANLKNKQSKLPTLKETGIKTDTSKALVVCKPKTNDNNKTMTKVEIKCGPYTVEGVCAAMRKHGHMINEYFVKDNLIPELQARGMPRYYDNEAAAQAVMSFMRFEDPRWK